MQIETAGHVAQADVLARLEDTTRARDSASLSQRLAELRAFTMGDLLEVEHALAALDRKDTPMHASARLLLDLGGKRLRPLCVALASRLGSGFTPAAREVAVAVELVHSATLLHDDVVDLGELRRGMSTARLVYGNAASIFAGDWLLVDALMRVQVACPPSVLVGLLSVLRRMLDAESLQLKLRGSLTSGKDDYLRIVEGKTASLFEWALSAGAFVAGAPPAACEALVAYGRGVGTAFQIVDDVLDVAGDPARTGKTLLADVREGKATYPLLLAIEKDRGLGPLLEAAAEGTEACDDVLRARVASAIAAAEAVPRSLSLARTLTEDAVRALATVPAGRARDALTDVACSMLERGA
jgi:octaprenyl-diphosphate synthase